MSMDVHGMSRLNCVWNCSSGFCRTERPRIHIFAGENVCIQVITPAQRGVGGRRFERHGNFIGRLDCRFPDDRIGNDAAGVQPVDDGAAVAGNLLERFGTVEVLTAGDEPDFEVGFFRDHGVSLTRTE